MNSKQTIGIVDDRESIRELLKEFLEQEDFAVVTAEDGLQAIELVKNNDLQLLFMDLRMPNLNGVEALAEIKKVKPEQKVIMMTAYGEENILDQAMSLGAYDYIAKPFDLFELATKLQNILSS